MKKVINCKVYDTATAKKVASWSNGRSYNDVNYCVETLYQKKTGEYFIHGEGGSQTKYAKYITNNSWGYGKELLPLTYGSAKQWSKEHLSAEEYEAIFGPVVEDNTKITICISIKTSNADKAKRLAAENGKGVSEWFDNMLNNL